MVHNIKNIKGKITMKIPKGNTRHKDIHKSYEDVSFIKLTYRFSFVMQITCNTSSVLHR